MAFSRDVGARTQVPRRFETQRSRLRKAGHVGDPRDRESSGSKRFRDVLKNLREKRYRPNQHLGHDLGLRILDRCSLPGRICRNCGDRISSGLRRLTPNHDELAIDVGFEINPPHKIFSLKINCHSPMRKAPRKLHRQKSTRTLSARVQKSTPHSLAQHRGRNGPSAPTVPRSRASLGPSRSKF